MKRKSITETVHPEILKAAQAANTSYNKHLEALRKAGYYQGNSISLELSVLMVETASIIHDLEGLKNNAK